MSKKAKTCRRRSGNWLKTAA